MGLREGTPDELYLFFLDLSAKHNCSRQKLGLGYDFWTLIQYWRSRDTVVLSPCHQGEQMPQGVSPVQLGWLWDGDAEGNAHGDFGLKSGLTGEILGFVSFLGRGTHIQVFHTL